MSLYTTVKPTPIDEKQSRLMQFAALFMLCYSLALTLAPAARLHSWQVDFRWTHWIGFSVWLAGTAYVHHQLMNRLPDRDPYLFPTGALLSGWGLLTIWRLDLVMGARQTVWLVLGLAVITAGLRIADLLPLIRRYKYLWLTSGLLLVGLTFIFGTYPGGYGPHLWLGCCGVYLQPSEPLKLLLIAYLAAYLADRLPISENLFQLLVPTLLLIGLALALLVAQRDLGTASLFILIYTIVVYIASNRRQIILISLLTLLIAGVTGYLLFDVVRIRVDAWINPWLDPAGRSYQIIQSLIAVASGGLFGHGPGMGSPGIVPVAHSDFIFASLAEETGLFGAAGLCGLFAILVGRGIRTALYAENNYRRYLAAGVTVYLAAQGIFIIGGNLRLLPLTGVTLPFVSYGGSSLLTAYISLLFLILVSSQEEEYIAPLRSPAPYLLVAGGLLAGLFVVALGTGYWAVIRNEVLTSRPENPRRAITDRFVQRGALLDRNNTPIDITKGSPGNYQRVYNYPPLSNTTGYNSPLYGQSGLEAGLDGYLRGLQGNPETLVWFDQLLYGQPPPGVDVRLSLDLQLQKEADTLLAGHKGALVLMNAATGEILVMASHPNFDPNHLEENWLELLQNQSAPLVNRATQGQYPPGTALGPFLLGYVSRGSSLPVISNLEDYTTPEKTWTCAIQPEAPLSIGKIIASGCPAPSVSIALRIGPQELQNLLASLGLYSAPVLPLQVASPPTAAIQQVDLAAIGQEGLTVTPLQMALAASALSNNGVRPSPMLALATLNPDAGWEALPPNLKFESLLVGGTAAATRVLAIDSKPYWHTVAHAQTSDQVLTWYLAGSLPGWQGAPLALALVLEEPNPELAVQIGQTLMETSNK